MQRPDAANHSDIPPTRAEVVDHLRRLLPRLESIGASPRATTFGLPALDEHLPQGGLVGGALHEVAPASIGDMPAAVGFITAILGRLPPQGPLLFVASRTVLDGYRLHGHGLNALGLDPSRLILVDTADDKQSLWSLEQALHSGAPEAVAGVVEMLDLKTSQRLHHAAAESGRLLLLLRPAGAMGSSVAVTRWRIGAAKAPRDRFGLITGCRWDIHLERCRNGRPGQWLVEFDHAAHRFSLAPPVAGSAVSRVREAQRRTAGRRS